MLPYRKERVCNFKGILYIKYSYDIFFSINWSTFFKFSNIAYNDVHLLLGGVLMCIWKKFINIQCTMKYINLKLLWSFNNQGDNRNATNTTWNNI